MKKHNTLFVLLFTILFLVLLTWILPVTYLNGELVTDARSQAGIVSLFSYPTYLMYNFVYIFMYVILVGGFYSVLNKTGVYRKLLDKIVKFVKGKELLFSILTVLLVSVIVSFTGFTYEAILIFPFIIAIVFLLGYDKIVAAFITLGSIVTGIMGSTFSKLVNGTFNGVLNTNSTVVSFTDLIWVKVIMLIVCDAILILNIILYVKKHKPSKNIEENMFVPEKSKDDKKKLWPLVAVLIVTLVFIIVGTINWSGAFKITWFSDILEKFNSLTIKDYAIFSKISGTLIAFGEWTYNEYIVFLLFIILIIKFIYRVKFTELFDAIFDGMKNYLYAAIIMLFSYIVLIYTSNHPVLLTALKPLLQITDGFNSVTLSIGTFISALFNTDFAFHTFSVLPLTYVTSYITDTSVYGLCELITQAMYGLAMLVAPTSIVLLFNLNSLHITYLEWLKKVWKLFVELLIVAFVIFTIVLLII